MPPGAGKNDNVSHAKGFDGAVLSIRRTIFVSSEVEVAYAVFNWANVLHTLPINPHASLQLEIESLISAKLLNTESSTCKTT